MSRRESGYALVTVLLLATVFAQVGNFVTHFKGKPLTIVLVNPTYVCERAHSQPGCIALASLRAWRG